MDLQTVSNGLFAALYAGMAILFVALIFVRDGHRFRRLIALGLTLVVGSIAIFWWLVASTWHDVARPG